MEVCGIDVSADTPDMGDTIVCHHFFIVENERGVRRMKSFAERVFQRTFLCNPSRASMLGFFWSHDETESLANLVIVYDPAETEPPIIDFGLQEIAWVQIKDNQTIVSIPEVHIKESRFEGIRLSLKAGNPIDPFSLMTKA